MSSIGEARERLAQAGELAEQAQRAVGSAVEAVGEALALVAEAAGDSTHVQVEGALGRFREAGESLEAAAGLIAGAREAAEEYADGLG